MRTLALAMCGPVLVWAASAAAQDKKRDAAAADALFRRGVELLKADDWTNGCASFEASMKLEPSVGTQINLARCADHAGRIAEAWAAFRKAKELNLETPLAKRKANVDTFVDGEIARLEAKLPWLTVAVSVSGAKGDAPSAASIQGLVIERNGVELPPESLGLAVPVDPGKQVFRIVAPGYKESTVTIDMKESEKRTVTLTLEAAPVAPIATPPPSPQGGARGSTPPPPERKTSPLVYAGIGVASLGAASLIAAAVTGGLAKADSDTVDDLVESGACSAGSTINCATDADQASANDAVGRGETLALTSTVTLFAGIGLAATGVVLIAVGATAAPTDEVAVVPIVGPGGFGLTIAFATP